MSLIDKLKQYGYDDIWIRKNVTDESIVSSILNAGQYSNILNFDTFVKNSKKLHEDPWIKIDCGEKPNEAFYIRKTILNTLSDTEKLSIKTKCEDFCAWNLWQINRSSLWMSYSKAMIHCNKYKLEPKEFFKYIRKHRVDPKKCLYFKLFDDLSDIERCIAGAVTLPYKLKHGTTLDAIQNHAVEVMCKEPVCYLQGSAGVGKTTTTSEMISNVESQIACLAFTHKAKRCLASKIESAGLGHKVETLTIHAFINKYMKPEVFPPPTVIIIDECSMIDIELLADLARVLILKFTNGYSIKLVGDKEQLPPIGRGEFFRERVNKQNNVVELVKCYRTDKPDLFKAYQSIRNGQLPITSENVNIIFCKDDKDINSKVGALINKESEKQFIAWQNKDVWKINKWIQDKHLKTGKIGPTFWKSFFKGDEIVYCGENTELITNAMTGVVIDCLPKGLRIEWETNEVTIIDNENSIALKYCITVHKSQGSEYNEVVVPCYDASKMAKCLDRRWLYTAVTRGKNKVTIVCTESINELLQKVY
jgi:hypothetical protein